jgi:hypothetical protein
MNDWLDTFQKYAMLKEPPPIFARWAAIAALSALVQRKRWYMFKGDRSFFNFYIILCGPPTAGKGLALKPIRTILSQFKDQYIAPDSVTSAALADELQDSPSTVVEANGDLIEQNPLLVMCSELGNFLPEYDKGMMNKLIKLWDGEGWEERRRGVGKRLNITHAHLTLIAGTTPAYLANTLPDSAWEEGFMSRTVVVYHGAGSKNFFFEEAPEENIAEHAELLAGAATIGDKTGRIYWTKEALKLVNDWQQGGCAPAPTHPKLQFYNGRRLTNLIKLCGLSAISRGSDKIAAYDFERMLDLLLETELNLPDVFKAMRAGGDQQSIKEAWDYLHKIFIKMELKPVDRSYLVRFLQERVPAHSIDRIIEVMIQAKFIQAKGKGLIPLRPSGD